ncbi:ribitol-5-phosphate xylosyltransferase 1-like [Oppia nitens]|uniref:ribitol-5-phosphate xylosyltransferase 1-like n=1 Tax=Oppia nitens TaxID=1686743 RepID=UPI0023DB8B3C|nr:ribitol-5-phosphate xylosyltransferase 1-like [Oppia nitens]
MLTLLRLTVTIIVINLLLILYTVYVFYYKFSANFPTIAESVQQNVQNIDIIDIKNNNVLNTSHLMTIEIWSKAAIGLYLWQHILRGQIETRTENNAYISGSVKVNEFKFKFRSGPLLITESLQHLSAQNLILVLNGRDKDKIRFATEWIEGVKIVKDKIANIGIVMLGDEDCHNNWIKPYIESNGGFIKFLFVVYDWKAIDNHDIYQWPLGLATYRNFPNPDFNKINFQASRPYVCNFVATIYPDSSRQELINILNNKYRDICIIKVRYEWQPKETTDSLNYYVEALRLSDLTLSPIGRNHECYRIFEALSFGSVPVVEENMNHTKKTSCDKNEAYRLLKEANAPLIYVSNWTQDLPNILSNELNLSLEYKIQRRLYIIKWYSKFKTLIKSQFLKVINEKFV